jgi:hypothetical protein
MNEEYSFNLQTTQNKILEPITPEKSQYGAFIVKGNPEEITALKEHILKISTLRLIYQHKDNRYLKVTPATPEDNFR